MITNQEQFPTYNTLFPVLRTQTTCVNDPIKMTQEDLEIEVNHPIKRQLFFQNMGYKICDCYYEQPAEEEGQERVPYLSLEFLPLKQEVQNEISKDLMINIVRVFMKVEYFMDRINKNRELFNIIEKDILDKPGDSIHLLWLEDAYKLSHYGSLESAKSEISKFLKNNLLIH